MVNVRLVNWGSQPNVYLYKLHKHEHRVVSLPPDNEEKKNIERDYVSTCANTPSQLRVDHTP